jgi:hypothetical protein
MKFVTERPFSDPDAAARKLAEIANAVEAVQDGRLYRTGQRRVPRSWRHTGSIPRRARAHHFSGLAVAARERHLREVHARRCRQGRQGGRMKFVTERPFSDPDAAAVFCRSCRRQQPTCRGLA